MATSQTTNNPPYSAADITAAYKDIFGGLPAGMVDLKTGELAKGLENGIYPGTVLKTPTGQDIDSSQLMYMYQQSKAQKTQAAAGGGSGTGGQVMPMGTGGQVMSQGQGSTSYLPNQSNSGATMANGTTTTQGNSGSLYFGGNPLSDAQTAQVMNLYQAYENGDANAGQQLVKWGAGMGLQPGELNAAVANLRQGTGPNAASVDTKLPEQRALEQQAQIDPTSEALRGNLAASYTDPSQKATPADYQSYLDTFKAVDPVEYAQRQGLATSMDSYLKAMQDQYAQGSQLDPITQMQVEQQARKAQADRGNLYGSGQAAVEAMTTGQAGQALLEQRRANLAAGLGQQQSYLGAGLGMGDTAMQLYQQGLQNKANAQQSALSYLSSGQTPYQTGASYMDRANANAAQAASGGPVYNPASLGAGNLGTAQQAPQYGLDIGAQSQNYFNSLNNQYGGGSGASQKNRGVSAATGAATGALSGAAAGSVVPVYGTAIGAVVGGVAGGLGGYYS